MAYSRIRDLNNTKENWVIQARLCRTWEAVDFKNKDEVFAIEAVFVDAQGDTIQAYVRKNHMARFKPILREGDIYVIRNFKVGIASVQYKVVPNNRRIYFNVTTSLRATPSVENQIPTHGFSFVSDDALDSRVGDNTLLTDIIGCVVAVGPIEIVATGPKKEIELRNHRDTLMKVTLWRHTSSLFDLTPYEAAGAPIIAIITSTTVRKYKGDFTCNSTTASRVYLNLQLPEVESLTQAFLNNYNGIRSLEPITAAPIPLAEQAFVNRTTIRELLAMEWVAEKQEHMCTCFGEIVEINDRYGWCYVSCNDCHKKALPKDGSFVCTDCAKTCPYPAMRYKVHVRVKDSTGTTTLVLFDDDVARFVKTPASTFMERIATGGSGIPPALTNLIGKSFVFRIKVTDYNLKDGLENYTVTRIFEYTMTGGEEEHKRKLEGGNAPTDKIAPDSIDSGASSCSHPVPPITPQKQPADLKKVKRAE